MMEEAVHTTADGRQLWVIHGDYFDAVVCGHIHRAEMRDIGGVLYCNDGDWVESRTALVEHFDGTLELLHWAPAHETQGRGHVGLTVTA